jgi:hypothetical protein
MPATSPRRLHLNAFLMNARLFTSSPVSSRPADGLLKGTPVT